MIREAYLETVRCYPQWLVIGFSDRLQKTFCLVSLSVPLYGEQVHGFQFHPLS